MIWGTVRQPFLSAVCLLAAGAVGAAGNAIVIRDLTVDVGKTYAVGPSVDTVRVERLCLRERATMKFGAETAVLIARTVDMAPGSAIRIDGYRGLDGSRGGVGIRGSKGFPGASAPCPATSPTAAQAGGEGTAGRTGQEYNQRKNRKGAYWKRGLLLTQLVHLQHDS